MKKRMRYVAALGALVAMIPLGSAHAETLVDVIVTAPDAFTSTSLNNADHYAATTGTVHNNASCRVELPELVTRGETQVSIVGVKGEDIAETSSTCVDITGEPIPDHRINFYIEQYIPYSGWALVTSKTCAGNGASGASVAPCTIDKVYNFNDPAVYRVRRACVLLVAPVIPAFQGRPLCSAPLAPLNATLTTFTDG